MIKLRKQDWIKKLLEATPENLQNAESLLDHSEQTAETTRQILKAILKKYPNLPFIQEELVLAAELHDIGRLLKKDQIFHELRGASYLEKQGLTLRVASSLAGIYRIAQSIRSHGGVYEAWQNPEYAEKRKEFEPLETSLLIPRTWQEAIVAYADICTLNGKRVDAQERVKEILQRYQDDKQTIQNTKKSVNRLLELEKRVKALEKGALSEEEICRYGFL